MSVEILLVPLALAAVHAVAAIGGGVAAGITEGAEPPCIVQTRLKHPGLLVAALRSMGATASAAESGVRGELDDLEFSFAHHEDGTLSAHFPAGTDTERAREFVLATDAAYALGVQEAVRQRVRSRAGELGMTVESETVDENHAVTLVLNVDTR